MLTTDTIRTQLPYCLSDSEFPFLGMCYRGKVRDCYVKNGRRYLITSDRLSCFDVVVTSIPFKGQALTQMALHWFKETESIIKNHVIDAPDPNVIIGEECAVIPIEVVMRGYLAGSAWRDYEAGRPVSGVRLPSGLRRGEILPEPLLTPSTKAEKGSHDEPIAESEILRRGIVPAALWEEIREAAFALFSLGQKRASERGLLLVDTKYEFGLLGGKLTLVDEIHTMDSSRYWVAESYSTRFEQGQDAEMLDKEPTRQWLISQGYMGEGAIPHFSDEHRIQISKHYIASYERITGQEFYGQTGDPRPRIEMALKQVVDFR